MKMKNMSIFFLIVTLMSGLYTNENVEAAQKEKLNEINKISLGTQHLLVRGRDGSVWSGGTNAMTFPGLVSEQFGVLPTATKVVDVSAGNFQTLALTSNGTLLSWPGTEDRAIPDQITSVKNIVAIAAGSRFNTILRGDGTVWTWGSNTLGELGLGDNETRMVPTQVPNLSNVVEIAASYQTAYALKSDGSVWGWGANNTYQLGNGSTNSASQPVRLNIPVKVKHIYQKAGYGAAVDIDDEVWTWGSNSLGQLGDGTQNNKIIPSKVAGLQGIKQLALGNSHMLALKENGSVIAWGSNTRGSLGDGTTMNSFVPVVVKGLEDINSISAGANSSAAISNTSKIFIWGMDLTNKGVNVITPIRLFVDDYSLEVPRELKMKATNSKTVTLTWSTLIKQDDDIDGFNVYCNDILIGNTKERKYVIENIDSAQENRFYVTTKGKFGNESDPSNIVVKKKQQKYVYTYNSSGQLLSIQYESGKKIIYEYDKNGNLKKIIITNPY
ncbi:hypothetical protein HUB98_03715 [Paenibacillus barcinonensis]|uniref:YD repeat-containing protein n=1 Tax=Paenibacillus barcinonensis TaxID=198119 RepID=A0A2V4VRS0_PAEBA|nr:hypothetical protein [Paenibacillus barcinonensis]PYE49290.1 YD repeat-containing protein [Paenibacillus barcinonensis]QKS55508.1 hypothetical protein HUB98_03715 [Paenibacillus barcinonensis]